MACIIPPWRDFPYEIGKLYTANIGYHERLYEVDGHPIKTTIIKEGLHAYVDPSKAVLVATHLPVSEIVIAKAIIPRGAMYVFGTEDDIVSTQLKIVEICH